MRSLTHGHLKSGLDSLRSAKFRSFWTMLGVIIGVASVITIISIGEGIKQQVGGQIHHSGKNLITVQPALLNTSSNSGSKGLNLLAGLNVTAPLTAKDIKTVAKTPGVAKSAPLTIATGTVHGDSSVYARGFVIGTTSDLPSLLNQSIAYGAFFEAQDDGSNVAVLGQNAVDAMFDQDVPLGRSFSFHGEDFVVIGIFNQFNTTPLSRQADFNSAIFIPNGTAERLTNNTAPTYSILVRPDNAAKTKLVTERIRQALDASHGGQSGFQVLSGSQNISASDTIVTLLTRSLAGIAAISLLVGGIGIMNVMLVSVSERTHEIGIRKAVGATNRQIWSQFMIESALLTFIGGLIGLIFAILLDGFIRLATNLQPVISWQIVALTSGVTVVVGVVFGTVPAVKAARKQPIESLRNI